jgi:hypothetical protein
VPVFKEPPWWKVVSLTLLKHGETNKIEIQLKPCEMEIWEKDELESLYRIKTSNWIGKKTISLKN